VYATSGSIALRIATAILSDRVENLDLSERTFRTSALQAKDMLARGRPPGGRRFLSTTGGVPGKKKKKKTKSGTNGRSAGGGQRSRSGVALKRNNHNEY